MTDEKLRATYIAQIARDAPSDRADCPSPEQLQRLAETGKGGSDTNLTHLDHVFGCHFCRPEFELLRVVQIESDAADGQDVAPSKARSRWFTAPRLAIAAGLLVAAGIGGEALRRARANASSEVVRDGAGDASDVLLVAPLSTADGVRFVWRKVTGAVTYEVQVLDTTGGVVATRVTSDTVFSPSASEQANLELAGTIDWFVAAKRADGNERRSNIARVRVGTRERR